MKEIKNVILCGMGAVGSVYAYKINEYSKLNKDVDFRVLVDEERYKRYKKAPVLFNNKELDVKYILPDADEFKADLIIIATKMSGLNSVLKELKNFIGDNTVIISLINGVTSEEIVAESYGREKVLYSYFIGHSTVRTGNSVIHDDVNTIVFGSDNPSDELNVVRVRDFFDKVGINYKIPDDIRHSMWAKFMLNVSANPTTALFRMNFGQMLNNEKFMELAKKIMLEVVPIAKAENIKNSENLVQEVIANLKTMSYEGRTSMLQDVEAGRKTENDIFAGAVVKLGKKYNIDTPYCSIIDEFFKVIDN